MKLNQYQEAARRTAIYTEEAGIHYTVLGLVGEAGEVAEKLKKRMRGGDDKSGTVEDSLAGELGDVRWYLANCASELGINLTDIAL